MGKILFWLVVVVVVLFVLRLINVANDRRRRSRGNAPGAQTDAAMIRCVECGVYLPSADAKAGARGPLCGDPQCVKRHQDAGR